MSIKDVAFGSRVVIYPNPVKDEINLQVSTNTFIKSMAVFSATGKKIAVTKNTMPNVISLATGLYFLHIESDLGEIAIKKFVKK